MLKAISSLAVLVMLSLPLCGPSKAASQPVSELGESLSVVRQDCARYQYCYSFFDTAADQAGDAIADPPPGIPGPAPGTPIPPAILSGAPIAAAFPVGTTSVPLSVLTDRPAVCKYGTVPGTPYSNLSNALTTTDGLSHSGSIGVADRHFLSLYVRCDSNGVVNTNDFLLTFSVAIDSGPPLLAAPDTFFDPPQTQGETTFTLVPVESARAGQSLIVAFGVPLPKGFVPITALNSVRVLDAQRNELPVFTKLLLPWRNIGTLTDESSARAILVEMNVTFPSLNGQTAPVPLILEWGKTVRQSPALSERAVTDSWVQVNDTTYPGSYGVSEPLAYALFTPEWYGKAVIKTHLLPLNSLPVFSAYDTLFPLFGRTAINDVDPRVTGPNLIDYLKNFEPWLFDRAMALYQLAFRSGQFEFLRQAHRAANYYAGKILPTGFFGLKAADEKYVYGESIVTDYILTGDPRHLDTIRRITAPWASFKMRYTPDAAFWTERHAAFKMLAATTVYELTGDLTSGRNAQDGLTALLNMANAPLPPAPNTGAFMHTSASGEEGGEEYIYSVWMSTLLLDALERYYIHSGDQRIKKLVFRFADYLSSSSDALYWSREAVKTNLLMPLYLAGPNLTPAQRDPNGLTDLEHAIDVSKILALAYYFSRVDGKPNPSYLATFSDLYKTQVEATWPRWVRIEAAGSGASPYCLGPARKFNWWYRTTADIDWLVGNIPSLTERQDASGARLQVILAADRTTAAPGDVIKYTVSYANIGSEDAKSLVLRIPVNIYNSGADVEIDEYRVSKGGTAGDGAVWWKIGSLQAGATGKPVTFRLKIPKNRSIPQPGRSKPPYLAVASASYCTLSDPPSACIPDVQYTRTKFSNYVVVQR
ncbi:MAG: hypothetical protein ABSC08_05375 [Bryobacteraceae bacterium]